MAIWVYSGATGSGDGSSKANAYTTLQTGLQQAVSSAVDLFVHKDHAEAAIGTSATLAGGATQAAAVRIVVVDDTGADVSAASAVTISLAAGINLNVSGYAVCRGLSFTAGTGTSATQSLLTASLAATGWRFENSKLSMNNTNGTPTFLSTTAVGAKVDLVNTQLSFGATGQFIPIQGADLTWKNTRSNAILGTVPTVLFGPASGSVRPASALVEGVDLSAMVAGKFLAALPYANKIDFKDCLLSPNLGGVISGTPAVGSRVRLIRCSDTNGAPVAGVWTYEGAQATSTAVTLAGGATDGTSLRSLAITPSVNATWVNPVEALPIQVWNDTVGQITVTLRGLVAGSALPNIDDIWPEIEYLKDSGDALGAFATGTKVGPLAATAAWVADASASWSGLGGTVTAFAMAVTLTPGRKGFLTIRLKGAKAGTFYVDPKPVCTDTNGTAINVVSRTFMGAQGTYENETGAISTVTVTNTVNQFIPLRRPSFRS